MSELSTRAPYWPVQLVRAVPAIIVGLVITFSADHSATFGLVVFGVFALASGLVIGWGALLQDNRTRRSVALTQSVAASLSGIVALVFFDAGAGTLFLIVIAFAAVTGFLELYLGLLARGKDPLARDWIAAGVLTALLALAVLLVPADYAAPWSVADRGGSASGILTSQIIVVGIIGAYAFLLGVYLTIAGLSAKWTAKDNTATVNQVTGQ